MERRRSVAASTESEKSNETVPAAAHRAASEAELDCNSYDVYQSRSWSNVPRVANDGLTPYIWLAESPVVGRPPTVVFQPRDRPAASSSINLDDVITVEPVPMRPRVTLAALAETKRLSAFHSSVVSGFARIKRVRKGGSRYGDLKVAMSSGAVRFSSLMSILQRSGFTETQDYDDPRWVLRWAKRIEPEEYAAMRPYQKVNHFPGTWGIGRKDNLHRRLSALAKRLGRDHYWFTPHGFLLPRDYRALEIDYSMKLASLRSNDAPGDARKTPLYIMKRVASACGRGMKLISAPPALRQRKCLIQEYIDDPLLIDGKKFDLRIYVVVTSFYPLRVYVYREGLTRFASSPYPKGPNAQLKCRTAHLTNFSVNLYNKGSFQRPVLPSDGDSDDEPFSSDGEVPDEDADHQDNDRAGGSKWTLDMLEKYFAEQGLDWTTLWHRIDDIIMKTLLCVEADVVEHVRRFFAPGGCNGSGNCFELFGFDVLIRSNLTPVLMEVNIMPSLQTDSSDLDQHVKSNLIAEMLTLVGVVGVSSCKRKNLCDQCYPKEIPKDFSAQGIKEIVVAEEELARRGHFRRIFPVSGGWERYKAFFPAHRALNVELCGWEESKVQLRGRLVHRAFRFEDADLPS